MAHPGGRPRKKFDLKKVERCGKIGSSFDDMASMLGCSISTISALMNDEGSEFAKSYKKGFSMTCNRLRTKQIKMAVNGVVPMTIFMGKNLLGQQDTPTTTTNVMVANGYAHRPGQLDLDPCSPANRAKLLHLAELHQAIQEAALKAAAIEINPVEENKNGNGCDSVSSQSLHILPPPTLGK
jgi:hypothetical protein